MALPSRSKHPIYAAGYYTPRRFRPVHFLPPMKVRLKDSQARVKLKDTSKTQHTRTEEKHAPSATTGYFHPSSISYDKRGRYKRMVMTLACNLTLENVADMKFLCKDYVKPPYLLDKIRYPRDLIALLENQHLLAENSLYLIQTLLYYISRLDLYELVLDFRADTQKDYKEQGADIRAVYDIRNDTSKRVSLAQELSQFRQELKPKSRLHQADVNGLRNRLKDLTTKMHDNVSQLKQSTAGKRHLAALHDASMLPEIQVGGVGHDDSDEINSESEEKEGTVLKLKLHDRNHIVDSIPERKTRKRSRIPSERLSEMSSRFSISDSDVAQLTQDSPVQTPIDIPQVHVIMPHMSYEQDERLRLTPHVQESKQSEPEEQFRYATPIPPPRSVDLRAAGKISRSDDVFGGYGNGTHVERDAQKSLREISSTATTEEDCGYDNGNDLDTQHLSRAIQKLRRKMGIKVSRMKNGYAGNSFNSFERRKQSKSKKRKKEQKKASDTASSVQKVKNRKLEETTMTADKLPDIYDKFARHKSTLKVQYMNILK